MTAASVPALVIGALVVGGARLRGDGGLDPVPAREAAHHELTDPRYHHDPGLVARVIGWLVARAGDLLGLAHRAVPVGPLGAVGLAAALAVAIGLGIRAQGGLRREARAQRPLLEGAGELDAHGHGALADAALARGDWREAVVERFRETARVLEERGALDPRPGRTPAELARDALVPAATSVVLRAAADAFAAVVYGRATASRDTHAQVQRAAAAARTAGVGRDAGPPLPTSGSATAGSRP